MYTNIHAWIYHVHIYVYIYVCVYTQIYTYMYLYIYPFTYVYICIYTFIFVYIMHTYMYIRIYVNISLYIHIYTHSTINPYLNESPSKLSIILPLRPRCRNSKFRRCGHSVRRLQCAFSEMSFGGRFFISVRAWPLRESS